MDNEKILKITESLNQYMVQYGDGREVDAAALVDIKYLDGVIEKVISLICKIGVDENLQPNIHGVILDGCLEALNEFRQELV